MQSVTEAPIVEKLRRHLHRHGQLDTLYALGMKAINTAVLFKVLKGISFHRPNPAFLTCPPQYRATFLSQEALREAAQDPDNELSQKFADDAVSRGDQCFAICDGRRPVAYGWYAFRRTPIGVPGLLLHFGRQSVYMYKGFTHPSRRGQRLHAILRTMALRHYLSRGYDSAVCYVESTNFKSLKSCLRMGGRHFGSIYVVNILGEFAAYATRGCERYGLQLEAYSPSPFGTP